MATTVHERSTPLAFPPAQSGRVVEADRRRRLLDGTWASMLAAHVEEQLGPLRAKISGAPDTSANLFAAAVSQTSTMYDEAPQVRASDPALIRAWERALEPWWTLAGQHQQYVRGLQESLVYVGWDDDLGEPTYELVTPDRVDVEVASTNRARPVTVWWGRRRPVPDRKGEEAWYWDRWDVAGEQPSLKIFTNDRKQDVTFKFMSTPMVGESYKIRDPEGRPVLPFALYHAQGAVGSPWHPWARREVVFGTLQVGLLWTAAIHGMLRASWSQRVIVNGRVRGGATEGTGGTEGRRSVRHIEPDPTLVLQVEGDGANIGQWGSPLDLDKAERFCRLYEARLAIHFGLTPGDVVIESLNPTSGASLTVSEAGKRRIASRSAPNFRRGDRLLRRVVSAVYRAHDQELPDEGVSLRYSGMALTLAEREVAGRVARQERELGILDEVGAYQMVHPGTTAADAIEDLTEQRARASVLGMRRGEITPEPPAGTGTQQPDRSNDNDPV